MRQKFFEFEVPFLEWTVPIYGYGTLVLIGVIAALWILGRGSRERGWNPRIAQDNAIYVVLAGLLGGRVFYCIQFQEQYANDLMGVFRLWEGGLVLYGAIIGGSICLVARSWKYGFSALMFLDIVAPAAAIGVAFGRLGCLMNGCCWGKVCHPDFPLALRFPAGSPPALDLVTGSFDAVSGVSLGSLPVQPTQLYSSVNAFLICWILWYLGWGRPRSTAREIDRREAELMGRLKDKGLRKARLRHACELSTLAELSPAQQKLVDPHVEFIAPFLELQAQRARLGFPKPGSIIGTGALLYGVSRFVIEMVRGDHHPEPGSWPVSQTISFFVVALGIALIVWPDRTREGASVGRWGAPSAGPETLRSG